MRRWKVVEADPGDEAGLTDSELAGVSIVLAQTCIGDDVYYRAWEKIQPQVRLAMEFEDDADDGQPLVNIGPETA